MTIGSVDDEKHHIVGPVSRVRRVPRGGSLRLGLSLTLGLMLSLELGLNTRCRCNAVAVVLPTDADSRMEAITNRPKCAGASAS